MTVLAMDDFENIAVAVTLLFALCFIVCSLGQIPPKKRTILLISNFLLGFVVVGVPLAALGYFVLMSLCRGLLSPDPDLFEMSMIGFIFFLVYFCSLIVTLCFSIFAGVLWARKRDNKRYDNSKIAG